MSSSSKRWKPRYKRHEEAAPHQPETLDTLKKGVQYTTVELEAVSWAAFLLSRVKLPKDLSSNLISALQRPPAPHQNRIAFVFCRVTKLK